MEVDTPTPSLLERMGDSRRGGGRRSPGARRTASAPYQKRRDALGSSNADEDGIWKHDKHEGGSLASRLQGKESSGRPRHDLSVIHNALRGVSSDSGLSIKGASMPTQPIVEVKGLVAGTTPDDVKAIFQSCGPISKAILSKSSTPQSPYVLLYYQNREHATNAITKFNGLPADGQKLSVTLFSESSSVKERVNTGGKNDDLLLGAEPTSGKMYSDEIAANDPRAHVLTGDFSADEPTRGGRGRGRRGRGGGRRGGNIGRMEIDR